MKILTETDHFAAVVVPGGNQGFDSFASAVNGQLQNMEALSAMGLEPLHYLPRFSAWVCRKTAHQESEAA